MPAPRRRRCSSPRRTSAPTIRCTALWLRTVDQLLGIKERSFPADDYVGNALVWDKDTARAMTDAIKSATGLNWVLALCRKKKFSEYLMYGHFVANSPAHLATHRVTEDSIAVSHWDDTPLDRPAIEAMMRAASPEQVALCIQSYSSTSIDDIRDVFRLSSRDRRSPSLSPEDMGDAAEFEVRGEDALRPRLRRPS